MVISACSISARSPLVGWHRLILSSILFLYPYAGVDHIICYFYFIYFAILLIHRQRRDDLHCERKYGDAWREYMRRVPYRIVPGIF